MSSASLLKIGKLTIMRGRKKHRLQAQFILARACGKSVGAQGFRVGGLEFSIFPVVRKASVREAIGSHWALNGDFQFRLCKH